MIFWMVRGRVCTLDIFLHLKVASTVFPNLSWHCSLNVFSKTNKNLIIIPKLGKPVQRASVWEEKKEEIRVGHYPCPIIDVKTVALDKSCLWTFWITSKNQKKIQPGLGTEKAREGKERVHSHFSQGFCFCFPRPKNIHPEILMIMASF